MKTEKKRSFKGAVLITVVSVMSLLIVFLTSTLVLATAANNRAHKSYSSSQANYTARTAIDSILKAAKEDEDFATAMASLTSGGFDVDVTMDSTSAGMGRVTSARIEYAGSRDYYDSAENEWVSKDLLSITANVLYGGEEKTVTAYVLKNPPTSVSSAGCGGGFVTVGSAVVSNHTNSFCGTYLGIGLGSGSRVYQQNNPSLPAPYDEVSLNQKLYLNVKDGVSYSYDAEGRPFYAPENDDIMVTYYTGNDHTIEAPFVINGSLIVNTETEIIFSTKGSGMAVWGNMDVQNSSFRVSSETVNNDNAVSFNQEITKFQDIPYIYVDSLLKFNNQTVGDPKLPLNIFCGSMNAQQNGVNLYANVYCQDSDKTSVIGNTNTALHAWSNSVLNGTDTYLGSQTSGNFYTKGNLEVAGNGANIDGDLVVEGDLTLKGNLTVGGSVVVKGTLISESGSMTAGNGIYANSAMGNNISVNLGDKKMASNGVDELYEEQVNTYHAVLAKNVKIAENPYYIPFFNYAWLKKEAIATYGMTDSDGDGIIDGNFYDFSGSEIDTSLVLEKMDNVGDENTDTKDYDETVWVNRDDPTDITYNENDTYETSGFKYGDAVIGSPDLYAATHNSQLFPKEAEKAVILGFEEIGDGTPKSVSKIIQIVDEIEQNYNFDSDDTITEIPVKNGIRADVEATVYHSYDVPDEITQSCTLSGSGFNKTIYIKNTSSNNIWVKLENFSMEAKDFDDYGIIYDDSAPNCGNLILFIEGDATLNKGRIMTKSYYDIIRNGDPFQIATNDDLYVSGVTKVTNPKIKIYSEKAEYDAGGNLISQPSLTLTNNSIVTAMIEAPHLAFDLKTASTVSNQTFYNGTEINGKPGSADNIGVIGVLNVAKAEGQNNWTFLYTPDASSLPITPITPIGGDNSFVITYYEGF
ncbi:MAG: hypothetical protein K2O29_06740 [Ruminococcus sp.]|nr:hypothetical protein [Ruminococcus sp.]